MSSLFKENLDAFYKRFPEYQEKWKNRLEPVSVSGFKLRGDSDSYSLLENGKLIDSDSLSFSCPEPSNKDLPARILLLESFGLGSLVRKILESPLKTFENMLIVEPSFEQFIFVLQNVSIVKFLEDERIHFVVGATTDEAFAIFMQYLRVPEVAFRMDAFRVMHHPVLTNKHLDYFNVVWDEWTAARKQIRRHFGSISDSMTGFNFVIENIPWIKKTPGVLNLKDLFKGIPAIIISTGPSLNKSIEDIKALKNKALLLAADASLSILLDHGIEPHFVLTLERDLWSMKFFVKSSREHPKMQTNLIAYPLVPNESLREFKGTQWVAYRDFGYFFFFEHSLPRGIISSSTSVAHFCLRMADYFGCSSASLVGQDLAFDPDDFHSHADGVAYENWSQKSSMEALLKRIETEGLGKLLWVEGNMRAQVPTHSVYFSFMKEFSWEATRMSAPIFNCTEGGAKIPGIKWAPLKDLSADWKEVGDLFKLISERRDVEKRPFEDLISIQQFLSEIVDRFKTILSLTENLENENQLALEKRQEMVLSLRLAQTELLKDPRFVCFVVQNGGLEFLDAENEWACLKESSSFSERLSVLRRWTEVSMQVAFQMQESLTHAASEKKNS
ncbi:MAG: hypothetical protein JWQ35_1750 [Bacteriovoracaceae bacterium]|nr:hypothetical protein [Bacteriovoracaceae bacterium]